MIIVSQGTSRPPSAKLDIPPESSTRQTDSEDVRADPTQNDMTGKLESRLEISQQRQSDVICHITSVLFCQQAMHWLMSY